MRDEARATAEVFEAVFGAVAATRMRGVPILNPRLDVAAVGFQPMVLGGQPAHLGVLVTPWFLNIVARAADPAADGVTQGWTVMAEVEHALPAGRFPFLVCEEDGLGRFAMCSLFSPVTEFEDQAAALATAEAALAALLDADTDEAPAEDVEAITAMWQTGQWPDRSPDPDPAPAAALANDPAPSRRAFITAGMAATGEDA